MQEQVKKIQGHFKIEAIKDGVVIDTFEQKNLIMDSARKTFAKYLANEDGYQVINRLVLGTHGHIGSNEEGGGDILTPRNAANGFVSSKTELFSEEYGDVGTDTQAISFNVSGYSGDTVNAENDPSTVKCTILGSDVIYEILIANDSCNGDGTMIYTECAFYTGQDIFSMRTFKGKIKDDTVSLRITWKIMF